MSFGLLPTNSGTLISENCHVCPQECSSTGAFWGDAPVRANQYIAGATKKDKLAKAEPQLDRDSYRLKVEALLQGNDDMAIYRVQIWTLAKPEDCELGFGGMFGRTALFRRENGGKLLRADFFVVVHLTSAEFLKRPDGKAQFELRYAAGVASGASAVIDNVEATTKVNQLLEMDARDGIYKFGHTQVIGRYRGKNVQVIVN